MNLANLDLNLLFGLLALLEESNVTRAGERLGVGQPTMSAVLARLRRHYGDDLLVRVGREYELTPLARALLPQVRLTVPLLERALGRRPDVAPADERRTVTIALSDFARMVLADRFGRLCATAPGLRFELRPLPGDLRDERAVLDHDLVVAPAGAGYPGESALSFVDHYVCIADRDNPRIRNGAMSWEDFRAAPYAQATFGRPHHTAPRRLGELGYLPRPRVSTHGLLALPFVVAGTDLVALVPSRLAARLCPVTGTVAVEAPTGPIELIEMLWWHPSRSADPTHTWICAQLADGSPGHAPADPP